MKLKIDKATFVNWRFFLCMGMFILLSVIIFQDFIKTLINIESITYKAEDGTDIKTWGYLRDGVMYYDRAGFIFYYFGFFTIQTNIMIAVWFFVMAFFNTKVGKIKLISSTCSVAIATYIAVTMLIYNLMLLPVHVPKDGYDWFRQLSLHLIAPLVMICYTLFELKTDGVISVKEFAKKYLWKLYIYPIAYLIVNLIRGEVRRAGGWPRFTSYPYFFLEIHEKEAIKGVPIPGAVWLLIAAVLIIVIIAGLSLGFTKILNNRHLKATTNVIVETN
ncbi:Pr6Pr family membrane protein [Mesoplasma seiffertii]|uniref:Pr6Pr family membrane protein n=1 Tax=Mesoplasma seiffertii TaxID=28224 RepID=UPI00047B5DA8|nr:Pr6Pr family membrane protein [Mesoplasma seiffertii]